MICFLDRDGIINIDYGYVGSIERFEWQPGIFVLLSKLSSLGYKLVMITNQSGIGRRYYTLRDFYDLSFYILNYMHYNYQIDIEINYCPHLPSDDCKCRKPLPGMIQRYCVGQQDIFIGDQQSDMYAALAAGVKRRWLVSDVPKGAYTSHFRTVQELSHSLPELNVNHEACEPPG